MSNVQGEGQDRRSICNMSSKSSCLACRTEIGLSWELLVGIMDRGKPGLEDSIKFPTIVS